jgi:hypothetical protein
MLVIAFPKLHFHNWWVGCILWFSITAYCTGLLLARCHLKKFELDEDCLGNETVCDLFGYCMQTSCYLMFVEFLLTNGHIGFIAVMTAFWSHLIVVAATAISTMCRPELGWYFDVLVVPVCRLLVRTSMLRRVRANSHLGLFLMWVWSGLQLETEFLVPWRYFSTSVFCAYSHSKVY